MLVVLEVVLVVLGVVLSIPLPVLGADWIIPWSLLVLVVLGVVLMVLGVVLFIPLPVGPCLILWADRVILWSLLVLWSSSVVLLVLPELLVLSGIFSDTSRKGRVPSTLSSIVNLRTEHSSNFRRSASISSLLFACT